MDMDNRPVPYDPEEKVWQQGRGVVVTPGRIRPHSAAPHPRKPKPIVNGSSRLRQISATTVECSLLQKELWCVEERLKRHAIYTARLERVLAQVVALLQTKQMQPSNLERHL